MDGFHTVPWSLASPLEASRGGDIEEAEKEVPRSDLHNHKLLCLDGPDGSK